MCTAIVFGENNRYFGRNLDYEVSFGEQVVITPRNFGLYFRHAPDMKHHFAFVGMAHVRDGYPLYYDATNECGLSIAGLNFVGNCHFCEVALDMRENLCQFELIPYIMGKCGTVREAKTVFSRLNLLGEQFTPDLPIAQLHWLIADKDECCVLEATRCGVNVFCNPAGVLTNNPPFPFHWNNLNLYRKLSARDPEASWGVGGVQNAECRVQNAECRTRGGGENGGAGRVRSAECTMQSTECGVRSGDRDLSGIPFDMLSRGMGAFGLPGDWSSPSRFVRAAFVRANAVEVFGEDREGQNVAQFFHILSSVAMIKGCVAVGDKFEFTQYSSCCDTERGVYYFKTYGEDTARFVDMNACDFDANELVCLDLLDCNRA